MARSLKAQSAYDRGDMIHQIHARSDITYARDYKLMQRRPQGYGGW